jgi:putative ABC transport system permease protein
MFYSLAILWQDRQRFLPGILAVTFSAMLIALQCGLLLGLFSITSIPVDRTHADVWVMAPRVLSVDLGRPIPESYLARLARNPAIKRAEVYMQGFAYWSKPSGGMELCMIMGSRLDGDALGCVDRLTPELREKLTEPGSIIIDESEVERLGITGVGDTAEITGRRVRVVGLVKGLKSLAGPYVLCSVETARPILRYLPDQATYILGSCHNPGDAPAVVADMQRYDRQDAIASGDFSLKSRMHWLTKTKAGIAMGFAALLGLLVGAVVTSQTLYAATLASQREFAVLRALGIPRWRIAALVVAQALGVGLFGICLAAPVIFGLSALFDVLGAKILLPQWLLGLTGGVTVGMAVLSGMAALRSLRLIEPAVLLR